MCIIFSLQLNISYIFALSFFLVTQTEDQTIRACPRRLSNTTIHSDRSITRTLAIKCCSILIAYSLYRAASFCRSPLRAVPIWQD